MILGNLHLQAVLAIPLTISPPQGLGVAVLGKAAAHGQRGFRGIFRAHRQPPVLAPDLEAQPPLIFMAGIADRAQIADALILVVVRRQREQSLRRLRQLRIEQLVDFMMRIEIAASHGQRPDRGDTAEQEAEQTAAQGKPAGHGRGMV